MTGNVDGISAFVHIHQLTFQFGLELRKFLRHKLSIPSRLFATLVHGARASEVKMADLQQTLGQTLYLRSCLVEASPNEKAQWVEEKKHTIA